MLDGGSGRTGSGTEALRDAVRSVEAVAPDDRQAAIRRALLAVTAGDLDDVLHARFDVDADVLTTGLGASPGAASGRVYFSADDAVDAADRGEAVILVRNETTPADVHGMMVSEGLLTTRGGLVSHAALVARGWGTPAVVGAGDIEIVGDTFRVGDTVVAQGDVVSIDGSTGAVMVGEVTSSRQGLSDAFHTVLAWADEVRDGRVAVRANADTPDDVRRALELGADGVGLCRTEHMFLAPDRLPVMRRMLLARTPDEESTALDELRQVQEDDFVALLEALGGRPVTVRLLDPPLHEFLPPLLELEVKRAAHSLTVFEERELAAARSWAEHNPMLGTRGVRLAVVKPGLYATQVRALLGAVRRVAGTGVTPRVEIMVPLVSTAAEFVAARAWIDAEIFASGLPDDVRGGVQVGTMIETPRAALCAADIAASADFFSFGTNDLTQLTFGFSRDDLEHRTLPAYLDQGLLDANPFDTLDADGVGTLVRLAVDAARGAKPQIKLGVCGEHGGDPASIDVFVDAGLDSVSCSPFRVPIARLAVAQALLRRDHTED